MAVAGLSLASHAGLFAKLLNWALWISHVLLMIQSMWSSTVDILYSICGAAVLPPSIDLRLEHGGAKQASFGNWRVP